MYTREVKFGLMITSVLTTYNKRELLNLSKTELDGNPKWFKPLLISVGYAAPRTTTKAINFTTYSKLSRTIDLAVSVQLESSKAQNANLSYNKRKRLLKYRLR